MRSFFICQFFFILIYHHTLCAEATNPRKNLIVEFNPYVSILDRYDRNRYNISELLPMFAKVATEFDHVLIDLGDAFSHDRRGWVRKLNEFPPELSSSLLLSPLAAAQYNARRNSSQLKLEVWLAFTQVYFNKNWLYASRHLKYIAEKANDIYEGTVTTILLKYDDIKTTFEYAVNGVMRYEKVFQASVFKRDYKWGVIIENSECGPAEDTNIAEKVRELKVNIAVIKVDVQNVHSNLTSDCKSYKGSNNLTFWIKPQETDKEDTVSMTGFFEQWTRIQKLAEHNSMSVVVSSAFDADGGRNGWWRLKENPDYSSTSEYIFEAKKDIAEQFDTEANLMNLELVAKNEQKLTKEHVGIRFVIQTLTPTEIQAGCLGADRLFEEVIASYSKIVIIFYDMSKKNIADGLDCVARYFLKTMDVFFYIPYNVKPNGKTFNLIRSVHVQSAPKTNLTFIFEWRGSYDHYDRNDNYKLIRNQSGWHTKISFAFPISLCAESQSFITYKIIEVVELLEMSDMVLFNFKEDDKSVALGVNRMFQQRLVTFAQCGQFLNEIKSFSRSIGNVQMGFLMGAYELPSKYYFDAKALYNFVLYLDKLREWAAKKGTTVIMSGVLDTALPKNVNLGWWRRQSQYEMGKGNSSHQLIDKRMDLFGHPDVIKSSKRDGRDSGLSTSQVAAFSAPVCLAIVFLISIPICFLAQRYYKRKYLTSSEMNDFFRGNQNSNDTTHQSKLPYDKSKFEIGPKSFSIDHSRVLGSGEFGMVCPGKVEKPDGKFVEVAVKTVNSNKYHKSALTGLLSEIKVLAHVGKHENIIELLGAFTADLKRGNIFVFLELGQCGSLEKCLRNLCPQPNANNESSLDEDGVECAEMQTYVNTAFGIAVVLDASLSDDLYRWSREICSGMAYLASKHVVHADLATRNVLLNAEKTAKICDFGLSRRMYNYANYVKRGQDPLPWKWMPPESLTQREFNEKSDVWAYGVTLWEIYSLGATPYPGLSWDHNFPQMLERGFRMGKPKYNDRNMYSMMKNCWSTNPLGRPSFADLLLLFDNAEIVD